MFMPPSSRVPPSHVNSGMAPTATERRYDSHLEVVTGQPAYPTSQNADCQFRARAGRFWLHMQPGRSRCLTASSRNLDINAFDQFDALTSLAPTLARATGTPSSEPVACVLPWTEISVRNLPLQHPSWVLSKCTWGGHQWPS